MLSAKRQWVLNERIIRVVWARHAVSLAGPSVGVTICYRNHNCPVYMFKDIDIVVCSNEQLANEARTGTKLAWAMPWKEEENKVNSLEGGRRSQVTQRI